MLKTAECVTPGHPDKMCDQISDGILDFYLSKDPEARVAIEVLGGHGKVYVVGEVTCKEVVEAETLEAEIGYLVHKITKGADLLIDINIVQQSKEIANGVDTGGAGDQGIMVGYACTDNDDMIPMELFLARSLCKFIYEKYPYDGKTQISMDGDKITTVVASFQKVSSVELREMINEWIKKEVLFEEQKLNIVIFANPAGDWNQGGFDADTGLTGRKLAVDCYGPQIPIGGGAFSGKDPSKVDRSGAYMARKIAVDTLIRFQAREVMVKIAYAIGIAEPVMATAFVTAQNGNVSEHPLIGKDIKSYLTPKGIRDFLKLNEPQYEETARWGHFGNGFKWDKLG